MRIITHMVLCAIVLYALANSVISVSINNVVDAFSLSGTAQGMMSSMFSIGTMLALLLAPLIQGRVAKVTVLLSATALQAAMLALCGASPMFLLFCVSCAVLGGAGGLVDAYSNSMLADVHREDSTRYFGYLHGLFGVGSLLAPLAFYRLTGWVGWRGAFFALSGVLLVSLLVLWIYSRRAGQTEIQRATQEKVLSLPDLLSYVKSPRNRTLLLAGAFATATQTGILVWVLRYMSLRFGAEALGTTSISLFWICATINRLSVSRLRVEPIRLLVLGGGLAALCLGVGVLAGSAWAMVIAMGGLGFCTGHFMPTLFSEVSKGHEGRTTFATSVMIVVMGLTRSLVPLAMAWVSSMVSVAAGMLIPALTALGVVFAGLWLARIEGKDVREDAGEDAGEDVRG